MAPCACEEPHRLGRALFVVGLFLGCLVWPLWPIALMIAARLERDE